MILRRLADLNVGDTFVFQDNYNPAIFRGRSATITKVNRYPNFDHRYPSFDHYRPGAVCDVVVCISKTPEEVCLPAPFYYVYAGPDDEPLEVWVEASYVVDTTQEYPWDVF